MSAPKFVYSLEDKDENTIYPPQESLDTIIKYLDDNINSALHIRIKLIRDGIIIHTRTDPLPSLSNPAVRKIFNLPHKYTAAV